MNKKIICFTGLILLVGCLFIGCDVNLSFPFENPTLSVSQIGNSVELDWSSVWCAEEYEIQRSIVNKTSFQPRNYTSRTTWKDTSVNQGITYRYKVIALDSAGSIIGTSNVIEITTAEISSSNF